LVIFCVIFSAGFSTADTPSFGAGGKAAAAPPCAPGSGAVADASFTLSDGTAVATFTVLPGCGGTQVSFASYEMLSGPDELFPQTLYDSESQTLSEGRHSLTVNVPGCFWQIDLATGPVLSTIEKNSLYGGRLVIALHGGDAACPPTTTTGTSTTGTIPTGTTSTSTTGTTSTMTTGTTSITTPATTTSATSTAPTTTATTVTTTVQAPSPPAAVPPTVDVSVTKVADKTDATVGQHVTYILTVTNSGPATALDVVIVDPLPAQEALVSVSDPVCTGTAAVTCSFGALAAGATRIVTVVTVAQNVGAATNVVTASTTTPESNTTNNQSQTTVTIHDRFKPPAICARLTLDHTPLVAGREAALVVELRNGESASAGIRVDVRGPGIAEVRKTDATGRARFVVTPHGSGVLQVRALQSPSCPATLTERPVAGTFQPPAFTG